MIISSATAGSEWFLNGLATLQRQQLETQRQLSSGYQIQDAADSPSQAAELVGLGSTLAAAQTYQTNLGRVQAESSGADSSLGTAISLVEQARSLALQGANSTATGTDRQGLAAQIQGIQRQVVSIANTNVEGRYIFGGDSDQTAPYQFTGAGTTGATALSSGVSTRTINGTQGQPVYAALSAQQIFDPSGAGGAPAANNTLAALQSLQAALAANDQARIATALTSLESASGYLNQQQAYYGAAENRLTNEQNDTASQITALQARIGSIRDTNVAQAATDLTREATSQTAALSAQAAVPRKSLFDYLG
jgi:flagellar hook-associated protein 3 FlgL